MSSKLAYSGPGKGLRVPPWQPNRAFTYKDKVSIDASILRLTDFIRKGHGKTLVITGAGVSVPSGIRAYRGPGGSYEVNPDHRPIFHQEFIASPEFRRRYWARSYVGYPPVRNAIPNAIHQSLATLQELGHVSGLITQNVDGLHEKALDPQTEYIYTCPENIKTLHGTLRLAFCLDCHHIEQRNAYQDELTRLNPKWAELFDSEKYSQLNPDGDVSLQHLDEKDFVVAPCSKCGGPMKPTVTFFGGGVDETTQKAATQLVNESNRVLVIGSSLAVMSALRLVRLAHKENKPIAILNTGETRAEDMATLRIGHNGVDILPKVISCL